MLAASASRSLTGQRRSAYVGRFVMPVKLAIDGMPAEEIRLLDRAIRALDVLQGSDYGGVAIDERFVPTILGLLLDADASFMSDGRRRFVFRDTSMHGRPFGDLILRCTVRRIQELRLRCVAKSISYHPLRPTHNPFVLPETIDPCCHPHLPRNLWHSF